MRTPSEEAKFNTDLQAVIKATEKLWRRHHLTYDQTRYVAKEVRRALEIEQPWNRVRVVERLFPRGRATPNRSRLPLDWHAGLEVRQHSG